VTRRFTVEVPDGVLAGERRGTGPPLIFVHGMAGDRHEWDRLWDGLPSDASLLRYDLRGFGESCGEEGASFSHSDDLLALMDDQAIDRAVLAGLSMGGAIALNFALSHPERLTHLVLISPALVGWEWSDEWRAIWREVATAARAGNMDLARERWWMHPMFAGTRDSDAAGELRKAIEAFPGRQWVQDDQRSELPDVDRLHELAVPTLLLTGELDVPDIRLIADLIENAAPSVTRIDLPGAGHMLHLERTEAVTRLLANFLPLPVSPRSG